MPDHSKENDIFIDVYKPLPSGNSQLNSEQKHILHVVLGDRTCNQSKIDKSINYIAFAIIAAIIFFILWIPAVDNALRGVVPDYTMRLLFKTLLFFLIIYLLDRAFCNWRQDQVFCE